MFSTAADAGNGKRSTQHSAIYTYQARTQDFGFGGGRLTKEAGMVDGGRKATRGEN